MMASVTLEEHCQDWKSVFLLSQLSGLGFKKMLLMPYSWSFRILHFEVNHTVGTQIFKDI